MLYDRAKIWVEGGRGGNGCVSFRREAHVPRGGPDGGDGGSGGDVVLVCDASRRDLGAVRGRRHFRGRKGGNGEGSGRHGGRGDDLEIPVAPGTTGVGLEGERIDLTEPGQRAVVARGGRGGKGNRRFASSIRQTPRFAEKGDPGRQGWIVLQLKLLADVGLVGLPNAGKSSLLARLTRADPKVGDYPFTTLEPVLGTIEYDDRQVVIADIPGLIEGASEGAGLGHEFLAHVERCSVLVHLVEAFPEAGDPVANHSTVRHELEGHGAGLERLDEIVVLSKVDLIPPDEIESVRAELAEATGREVVAVSSATGYGIDDLRRAVRTRLSEAVDNAPQAASGFGAPPGETEFAVEHMVYRPAGEEGYRVLREGEAFRVEGRGVELLFERHDLKNEEALGYLEQRLREMGVVAALKSAGFEPGDDLLVGEHVLEFHPAD